MHNNAKLEIFLTVITVYRCALKLSPLARKDRCCILLEVQKLKSNYYKIRWRLVTQHAKQLVLRDSALQSWESIKTATAVHYKAEHLHQVVNQVLDTYCPLKISYLRCDCDAPLWMTVTLVKIIKARD